MLSFAHQKFGYKPNSRMYMICRPILAGISTGHVISLNAYNFLRMTVFKIRPNDMATASLMSVDMMPGAGAAVDKWFSLSMCF